MARPQAKKPLLPDSGVTLQVLGWVGPVLRMKLGVAVERSFIEPKPTHGPLGLVPGNPHRKLRYGTRRGGETSARCGHVQVVAFL
jgi:hypothetical protein